METDRFDRLVRALSAAPSRRRLTRWLAAAGLAAGGLAGIAAASEPAAAAKKKPRKCKPKCKACQRCTRGRCKPAREGESCAEGKICERGSCAALRCGNGGPCRVFLSSADRTGAGIGGLAGGDALCQQLADAVSLAGTYRAWLSDGSASPATRFTRLDKAGPYRLVPIDGNDANPPTVAANFADLIGCNQGSGECLQNAINRTESGQAQGGSPAVWTGTLADGTAAPETCAGWTSTVGEGAFGTATLATTGWTVSAFEFTCTSSLPIYCFEQA